MACVSSSTPAVPIPLSFYPTNFLPRQPAVVYLKKLHPDKHRITHTHVLKSLGDAGRRLTEEQTTAMIAEFQEEALTVIKWGVEEVKKRMLKAAARVGLELGGAPVDTYEDLKKSWEMDGEKTNTGKFYMICYGDYEGKKNQHWSRELEMRYMREQNIEYDTEPKLREKGGYEQCITHAKGNMVRQIMARGNKSHGGKIVLSLKNNKDLTEAMKTKNTGKPERRKEGEFFYKIRVSGNNTGQVRVGQMKASSHNFSPLSATNQKQGGIRRLQYGEDKRTLKQMEVIRREDKTHSKGSTETSPKRLIAENQDDSSTEGGSGDNHGTSEADRAEERRADKTIAALKNRHLRPLDPVRVTGEVMTVVWRPQSWPRNARRGTR